MFVCLCVCVCVCVLVFVINEDINLHNDMGITGITRRRGFMRSLPHVPIFQKSYESYRMSFFEKVKMQKVSCEV